MIPSLSLENLASQCHSLGAPDLGVIDTEPVNGKRNSRDSKFGPDFEGNSCTNDERRPRVHVVSALQHGSGEVINDTMHVLEQGPRDVVRDITASDEDDKNGKVASDTLYREREMHCFKEEGRDGGMGIGGLEIRPITFGRINKFRKDSAKWLLAASQDDARCWLRDTYVRVIKFLQSVSRVIPLPFPFNIIIIGLMWGVGAIVTLFIAMMEGLSGFAFYGRAWFAVKKQSEVNDQNKMKSEQHNSTAQNERTIQSSKPVEHVVSGLRGRLQLKGGRAYAKMGFGGKGIWDGLMDIGSTTSLMPTYVLDSLLQTEEGIVPNYEDEYVKCHNGTPMTMIGNVTLDVIIYQAMVGRYEEIMRMKDVHFLITSNRCDMVVGNDLHIDEEMAVLYKDGKPYLFTLKGEDLEGISKLEEESTYSQDDEGNIDRVPVWSVQDVEVKPDSIVWFYIKLETWPHTKTMMDNAEVSITLKIWDTPYVALTRFNQGHSKIMIHNKEGEFKIDSSKCIGMAHMIPKGCFKSQVKFEHVVSSLHQPQLEVQMPSKCFCKMKFNEPPVKIFFLNSNFTTSFSNMTLPAQVEDAKQQGTYNLLQMDTDTNHVYAGPHLELITGDQIRSLIPFMKDKKVIVCCLRETDLALEEMDFIQRMGKHFKTLEIRIYQSNGVYNLCMTHRPICRTVFAETNVVVLNGGMPQGDLGIMKHTSIVEGTQVDNYIKDDKLNLVIHLLHDNNMGKAYVRTLMQGVVRELKKAHCGQMINVALGIAGEASESLLDSGTLAPYCAGGITLVKMNLTGDNTFRSTRDCKCKSCTGTARYTKVSDLHSLVSVHSLANNSGHLCHKTSALDCFAEDLMSTTSERFPKDSETYSVVASDIDEVCYNEPIISTEDTPEEAAEKDKNMEDKYDYSNVPESEIEFVRWLIKSFPHVWTRNKDQRNFIRDTRIKLRLLLEEQPYQNKFYKADVLTCQIINRLLMEEVRERRAEVVHQPTFTNPVFIRLRNTKEVELMRKAMEIGDTTHVPKIRLIGDFRTLNAHLKKSHSYLPNIKEVLQRTCHYDYQSSFDVSKMFPSIPIAAEDMHLTTLQSPTNLCVQLMFVTEGIYTAPNVAQKVLQESLVLSNPSAYDLEKDKAQWIKDQKEGRKRIESYEELVEELAKPPKDELPQSHTRPYVPEGEITPEMRMPETQPARDKVYQEKPLVPIILRKHIVPGLLPTEHSCEMYMDDGHIGTNTGNTEHGVSESNLHRRAWIALMLDMSNNHWLLSLDKTQFFAITGAESTGELEFVGHILTRGSYRPMVERVNSIQRLQEPHNLKTLQKTLGLVNFLSEHTPGALEHAEKLYSSIPRARAQGNKFQLTEAERESFKKMKEVCADPIALAVPRPHEPLFIETDSSDTTCAFLCWVHSTDNKRRLVGYHARLYAQSLRSSSSAIEKELYSITQALHFYRHYIYSHPTYLMTDAKALCALFANNKVSPNHRLELMAAKISCYPIRLFIHIKDADSRSDVLTRLCKGRTKDKIYQVPSLRQLQKDVIEVPMTAGETLSWKEFQRRVQDEPTAVLPFLKEVKETKLNEELKSIAWDKIPESKDAEHFLGRVGLETIKTAPVLQDMAKTKQMVVKKTTRDFAGRPPGSTDVNGGNDFKLQTEDVKRVYHIASIYNPLQDCSLGVMLEEQAKDEQLVELIKKLQTAKKLPVQLQKFKLKNGTLLVKVDKDGGERIVANEKMLARICAQVHTMSHQSGQKMGKVVSRFFYGKGIRQIAQQVALTCKSCQQFKPNRLPGPPGRLKQSTVPHSLWGADHIILGNPLYQDGKYFTAICTLVDEYSSYTVAKLVTSLTANTMIQIINDMKTHYVLNNFTLHTDNAKTFVNSKLENYCKQHGITLRHNLPYASRSNAKVEKANDHIRDIFSVIYSTTNLNPETALMLTTVAINTTPRGILRHTNITPFEVIFGRVPMDFAIELEHHIPDLATRNRTREQIHQKIMALQEQERIAHEEMLAKYPRKVKLDVGVHVLIKNNRRKDKQQPRYDGQIYIITAKHGHKVNLQNVNDAADTRVVSTRNVKPYDLDACSIMKHLTDNQVQNLTQQKPSKTKRWRRLETEWSSIASTHGDEFDVDTVDVSLHNQEVRAKRVNHEKAKVASNHEEVDEEVSEAVATIENQEVVSEADEFCSGVNGFTSDESEHLSTDGEDDEQDTCDMNAISARIQKLYSSINDMHVQVTSPTDILEELGEELDGDEEVINNSKDRNKDDKLQEVDMANANEIRAASSLAGTQCGDEEQHKGLDTTIENLVVRFEDKKRRKLETTKVQADVAQPPDITVHVATSNSNAGSKAEQVNSTHGEDRNKIESEPKKVKEVRPENELVKKLNVVFEKQVKEGRFDKSTQGYRETKKQEVRSQIQNNLAQVRDQHAGIVVPDNQHQALPIFLPKPQNNQGHISHRVQNTRNQFREGKDLGRGMRNQFRRVDYSKLNQHGDKVMK